MGRPKAELGGGGQGQELVKNRALRGLTKVGQGEILCHSPASQPASLQALLLPVLLPQKEQFALPPLPQHLLPTRH